MKTFCTRCGTALSAGTRYCTNCGMENEIDANPDATPTVVAGVEPADAEIPGSSKPKKSRRWVWWVLALIGVFALGFFLGHRAAPKCPRCPAPSTAGAGGGGGGGGGGSGRPKAGAGGNGDHDKGGGGSASGLGRVLGDGGQVDGGGGGGSAGSGKGTGDMVGGGTYTANGTVVGHGNDSTATGASGSDDDDDGGSGGKGNPSQAPNGPESDSAARKRTEAGVWRLAAGGTLSADGVDTPLTSAKAASDNFLTAHDFRYDKTNLPRYPESVKDGYVWHEFWNRHVESLRNRGGLVPQELAARLAQYNDKRLRCARETAIARKHHENDRLTGRWFSGPARECRPGDRATREIEDLDVPTAGRLEN